MTDRSGGSGDPGWSPGSGPAAGPGRTGSGSPGSADDSRAEQVLSQALRAIAGGQPADNATAGRTVSRLSTGQLVLLAAIAGLLVGIGAGLLSLLL